MIDVFFYLSFHRKGKKKFRNNKIFLPKKTLSVQFLFVFPPFFFSFSLRPLRSIFARTFIKYSSLSLRLTLRLSLSFPLTFPLTLSFPFPFSPNLSDFAKIICFFGDYSNSSLYLCPRYSSLLTDNRFRIWWGCCHLLRQISLVISMLNAKNGWAIFILSPHPEMRWPQEIVFTPSLRCWRKMKPIGSPCASAIPVWRAWRRCRSVSMPARR